MKELSIEEKAKAYDNIIEKANKMHHENCEACQMCIEELIPELRESKDEKIRKELIDGFTVMKESKNCGKTFSNHNIPVADILAWLEKQGEQDIDISSFPKEQQVFMRKYVSFDKITLIKLLAERDANNAEIIESFEKQAEQKSIDDLTPQEAMDIAVAKCFEQGEQKPDENKGMNLVEEEMTPFQKKVFCIIDLTIEKEQGLKQVCDELLALAFNEIKQKPVELPKGEDYGIDGLYAAVDILQKTLGNVEGYQSDDGILEHKCAISAVKELYKQKPADNEMIEILRTEYEKGRADAISEMQKSVDNIESSAFKDKLLELFQRFRWYCKEKTPTNGDIIEYVDAHIQELIDTVKNEPAGWDDKDEDKMQIIINIIKDSDPDWEELINWLKSLKDRVLPKQEWNGTEIAPPIDSDVCG